MALCPGARLDSHYTAPATRVAGASFGRDLVAETWRVLACYAHPDDEAFGSGGTLTRYAAEGAQVTLVCATRGEAGEIAHESLAVPATLAQVREEELRCSCRTMGVAEPIFLGYRDSGMAGTPENEHAEAFCQAPADEVIARLVEIMRRLRPHVVLTFEPGGGYGHPDHIAIHRHTLAAFHAAADDTRFSGLGAPWQASRLYYTTIPRSFFLGMYERMKSTGVDVTPFEAMAQGLRGFPDEAVAAVIDVSRYVDEKWSAISCHRTQLNPNGPWSVLPERLLKQLFAQEHFALGWPEEQPPTQFSDLFQGL
jgi:N-acetyl-1-D-myo-inositol-2-amino-2-deoxy-alpha-D-glucopyranoside deacetylase